MKKCPNCGTKNSDSAKQCNFCHENLQDEQPITTPKKGTEYVHNEAAEKKKAKKRKIILALVSIIVVAALVGLLITVFSGSEESKSKALSSIISKSFTESNEFSGTIKGENLDISFSATVTPDSITVIMNGGKYDSLYISKDGMILKIDKENEKSELTVTPDMEEYNLYVSYLLLTASDKNPLTLDTKDIKKHILPIVKEHMISNFDQIFIEDNFAGSISSALMTFENDIYLRDYMGITLPDDVENAKIDFNIASYDLQNHMLSQFKKAYKNSSDYDTVNQTLKDAKSKVKKKYGANGSFNTENGELKSVSTDIIYKGVSYKLNINF
jgi:hypothetical protein